MEQVYLGVLDDTRTVEQKKRDWSSEEVMSSDSPTIWKPKTLEGLIKQPIWNQYMSSACVAFAKARQIAYEIYRLTGVWIDMSPASIYQLRVNKPGLGMIIHDANEIVNKRGVTLEALMKSQNLTEDQIEAVKRTRVADMFAAAIAEAVVSYLYVPVNIEKIAQVLEQKHAVSLLIFAVGEEYTDVPTIKHQYLEKQDATIVHEITAVDYYVNQDFGQCLWAEDSWGLDHGVGGRRTITKEFLSKRCVLADYFDIFSLEGGSVQKPKVKFERTLTYGMMGDPDVKILQNMLKYEGKFPVDKDATGNYLGLTADAVMRWQIENKVASESELIRLAGTSFGPVSRAFANKKFA